MHDRLSLFCCSASRAARKNRVRASRQSPGPICVLYGIASVNCSQASIPPLEDANPSDTSLICHRTSSGPATESRIELPAPTEPTFTTVTHRGAGNVDRSTRLQGGVDKPSRGSFVVHTRELWRTIPHREANGPLHRQPVPPLTYRATQKICVQNAVPPRSPMTRAGVNIRAVDVDSCSPMMKSTAALNGATSPTRGVTVSHALGQLAPLRCTIMGYQRSSATKIPGGTT